LADDPDDAGGEEEEDDDEQPARASAPITRTPTAK
jgi:hypothetical protein